MGLDIYLSWGEVEVVQEDDDYSYKRHVGWDAHPDSKWRDYYELQMTGFVSAPESGYLRESWGSLAWARKYAETVGAPLPYSFFPDWGGSNGEELSVTSANWPELDAFRQELISWVANNRKPPPNVKSSDHAAFLKRLRDVIGFLNLVQCKLDQPNLTIVFG